MVKIFVYDEMAIASYATIVRWNGIKQENNKVVKNCLTGPIHMLFAPSPLGCVIISENCEPFICGQGPGIRKLEHDTG